MLSKRPETRRVTLEELARIPAEDIIKVEDVTPPAFQKPEPQPPEVPPVAADATPEPQGQVNAYEAAHAQWLADKTEFERLHPVPADQKMVTFHAPAYHVTKVMMDGMPIRIFHTARATFIGAVRNEDSNRVMLYSPAIINPNVEVGRIHFLPVAFAGLDFILYKNACIGESVPQVAEIAGYPDFVAVNKRGDYQFRMKGAYHHLEADFPPDAAVVSVERDVRAHYAGFAPTLVTEEQVLVEKTQAFNQMVKPS